MTTNTKTRTNNTADYHNYDSYYDYYYDSVATWGPKAWYTADYQQQYTTDYSFECLYDQWSNRI